MRVVDLWLAGLLGGASWAHGAVGLAPALVGTVAAARPDLPAAVVPGQRVVYSPAVVYPNQLPTFADGRFAIYDVVDVNPSSNQATLISEYDGLTFTDVASRFTPLELAAAAYAAALQRINHWDYHVWLGRVLVATGQPEKAEEHLKNAIALNRGELRLYEEQAVVLASRPGKIHDAMQAVELAAGTNGTARGALRKAKFLLANEKYEEIFGTKADWIRLTDMDAGSSQNSPGAVDLATVAIERASRIADSSLADAHWVRGLARSKPQATSEDLHQASDDFGTALGLRPFSSPYALSQANTLLRLGQFPEAVSLAERAVTNANALSGALQEPLINGARQTIIRAQLLQAMALKNGGIDSRQHFDRAMTAYRDAVKDPEFHDSSLLRVRAALGYLLQTPQSDEDARSLVQAAADEAERALELDRQAVEPYLIKALVLLRQNQKVDANRYLAKLEQYNSRAKSCETRFMVALVETEIGNPAAAAKLFEQFHNDYPGFPTQKYLVDAYLLQDQEAKASALVSSQDDQVTFLGAFASMQAALREALTSAPATVPKTIEAAKQRWEPVWQAGEQALVHAGEATKPERARILAGQAQAYAAAQQFGDARAVMDRALGLAATDPEVLLALLVVGEALEKQNQDSTLKYPQDERNKAYNAIRDLVADRTTYRSPWLKKKVKETAQSLPINFGDLGQW